MKIVPIKWMASLKEEDIREAREEACVDCHDESEQCSGLTTIAAESLEFPFPAKVPGESVQIVGSTVSKYDSFGFDLVVEHKKNRYAIASHNVELLEPLPDGHLYLAACLDWRSRF
jgi:hypothetical protein